MDNDIFKETQDKHDAETMQLLLMNFESGDDISVSLIQRKCRAGYNSAYRVFERLADEGKIKRGSAFGSETSVSKFI